MRYFQVRAISFFMSGIAALIIIVTFWNASIAQERSGGRTLEPTPADQLVPEARSTTGNQEASPFLDAVAYTEKGERILDNDGRIVGGLPAPAAAYPWMVSIGVSSQPFSKGHFCGGSFLSNKWIITAAHCFNGISSVQQIQIKYGTNVLSAVGPVANVKRFVLHPQWNTLTFENDVALIELFESIDSITPIKLLDVANPNVFNTGVLAVAAGWGLTKEGGQVSDVLRHVGVQIVSNESCNAPQSYAGKVKESMFCAGFVEGVRDSCRGDSGGPLMAFNGRGGYVLVGVVSWGVGCARPNKYGIYTRLLQHTEWINSQLE